MKNGLFWALVVVVAVIFAVLAWAVFAGIQGSGVSNPVGAACTVAFLVVAFLGWEFLMKPGYGWIHRMRGSESPDEEGGEEGEPPSPGSP